MDCGCTIKRKKKMAKINFAKVASASLRKTVVTGGAAVGTRVLSKKVMPNVNPIIKGVGAIFLGCLPEALMPKSEVAKDAGAGLIAVGAIELAERFAPGMMESEPAAVQGIGSRAFVIEEDYETITGDQSPISGAEESNPTL